jgi:CRP-like cAMP-binding protein
MSLTSIEFLRRVPLFAQLDNNALHVLAEQLQQKHFLAGQTIFRQAETGDEMYIVQHGAVELFVYDPFGQQIAVNRVETGEVFGELATLDDETRSASAKAIHNTTLIVITRQNLHAIIQSHPDAAIHMLKVLARRIRYTSALLEERVVPNANAAIEAKVSLTDRVSDFMINASSNMAFIVFSLLWFTTWITWNLGLIPGAQPFDPFPFGLLTMIVSLEMVFLSLFILIKQSRQAANDKVRNEIEYQVNVRAEARIHAVARQVEALQELMMQHFANLKDTQPARIIVDADLTQEARPQPQANAAGD